MAAEWLANKGMCGCKNKCGCGSALQDEQKGEHLCAGNEYS